MAHATNLTDLAAVATRVSQRFVRQPQPAVVHPDHVEVHYDNAMCGHEVGNPLFAKIVTVADLEALFGTELTLRDTLELTEF